MSNICLKCNASGCQSRCSGCWLPDAYYCSRECQVADRKSHKGVCKLAGQFAQTDTKLALEYNYDNKTNKDHNAVLKFAKKYMPNVDHLEIRLHQAGMWKQDEMDSFDYVQYEPVINFTFDVLRDYLESTPLVSFKLVCEQCIEKFVAHITKNGSVFKPLCRSPTLRRFSISNMSVRKFEYIPFTEELRSLTLQSVKVGSWDDPRGWNNEVAEQMVSKISTMNNLESIKLGSAPLNDTHLERLLPNLQRVRTLEISGLWGSSHNRSIEEDGQITDTGCETVARLLPNLQSAQLNYQRCITRQGAMALVNGCLHLRHLGLEDVNVQPADLPGILAASKTLVLYSVGFLNGQVPSHGNNPSLLQNALQANEGRTVIYSGAGGLIQPTSLSESGKKRWEDSKKLVVDILNSEDNCNNMWAPLWGIDVMHTVD